MKKYCPQGFTLTGQISCELKIFTSEAVNSEDCNLQINYFHDIHWTKIDEK